MGILGIKLKAIKYNEDFSCYLSSFQTWVFRPHTFQSYLSGRIPLGPSFQAACYQDPWQTHSPKPWILDLFHVFKPPVRWVPCWLRIRRPTWQHLSQIFSCYCIAATGVIEHQGAVFVASNEPYSHHPHGGFKSLRLCVKLLSQLELIYMMTRPSARNCKAIRGDFVPQRNQIKEDRFPTNGKMLGWR